MVTASERYLEYKALLGYCADNKKELETKKVRAIALTHCLRRHWQDYIRLDSIEIRLNQDRLTRLKATGI